MLLELDAEYRSLRDAVQRIGEEVLSPNAQATDVEGRFPREQMRALAAEGICGLTVPRSLGGLGQDHTAYALAVETIATHCPSTAMVYVMHMTAVQTVHLCGSQSSRDWLLPPVREEGRVASLAFSEPATGGHFWYCVSQAERDGENYLLSAEKSFVTSAGQADWYIVQTRSPEATGPEDMSYFIVSGDQDGVKSGPWDALGLRGNSSGPMSFRDVKIPRSALLGKEGEAAYWNDNAIDPMFLLGSSACWLGIAQAALDEAVRTAKTREHKDFGMHLTDYQVIRLYISRMAIETQAVRSYLYLAARKMDQYTAEGRPHADLLYELWSLKVKSADNVIAVTDRAIQVCGGRGYKRGKVERLFRDGRAGAIMGPSNEMCQEWVSKTLLDMPLGYWYPGKDVDPSEVARKHGSRR